MTHQTAPEPPGDALAHVREELVARLSLAPDSSSAHTVEAYRNGLRFTLDPTNCHVPMYAYALPWARGWTVFVTSNPNASNQSWHNAQGYSQRVSNPRGVVGPEKVSQHKLINAIYGAIDYLDYHYSVRTTEETEDYFDGEDGDCTDVVFYGQP